MLPATCAPLAARITTCERRPAMTKKTERPSSRGSDADLRSYKSTIDKWQVALEAVFGRKIPNTYRSTEVEKIRSILTHLGARGANQTILPTGGNDVLAGARISKWEPGCLELRSGVDGDDVSIALPRALTFWTFPPHSTMSYFRLELEPLAPAIIRGKALERTRKQAATQNDFEELTEVAPGKYDNRARWDHDERQPGWRVVTRYFGKGAFLIFPRVTRFDRLVSRDECSTYVRLPATKLAQKVSALIEKATRSGVDIP